MATKEEKAWDAMRFDVRLTERALRSGKLDPKDYEANLKKLPDDEARAEYIEVYEEPPAEEVAPSPEALTFT
jgi:hypothetical protein